MGLAGGALWGSPAVSAHEGNSAEPCQHQGQPCSPACPQMCDGRVTGACQPPTRPCSELGDRTVPQEPLSTRIPDKSGGGSCCGWEECARRDPGSTQPCLSSQRQPRELQSSGNVPGSATINSCLRRDLPAPTALRNSSSFQAGSRPICSIPSWAGKGLHSTNWI